MTTPAKQGPVLQIPFIKLYGPVPEALEGKPLAYRPEGSYGPLNNMNIRILQARVAGLSAVFGRYLDDQLT